MSGITFRSVRRRWRGRHAEPAWHRVYWGALLALALVSVGCLLAAGSASASAVVGSHAGNRALSWAEARTDGHSYLWGGTGPWGYDCSGVVYEAFLHADGINIGRDTYDMLSTGGNGHFHRVPLSEATRGDVLFFGTWHVMLDTLWAHTAYGALDSGTPIGWHQWWPGGWQPTEAFRVW